MELFLRCLVSVSYCITLLVFQISGVLSFERAPDAVPKLIGILEREEDAAAAAKEHLPNCRLRQLHFE